jgi:Fe2+ transport system protein FeoA
MSIDDTAEQGNNKNIVFLNTVAAGKCCRLVGVHRGHHGRHRVGFLGHPHGEGLGESMHGFHGGMRVLRRLLDLGLTTGCSFEVIHGGERGPVLLQVRGTRVALGQGLASRLLVEVVDE